MKDAVGASFLSVMPAAASISHSRRPVRGGALNRHGSSVIRRPIYTIEIVFRSVAIPQPANRYDSGCTGSIIATNN